MIKILKKAETQGQCNIDPLAILILGSIVKTSEDWEKKCFLTLFSLEKAIFSTFKHPFYFFSIWYYHSCVPGEILTNFDPKYLSVGPK